MRKTFTKICVFSLLLICSLQILRCPQNYSLRDSAIPHISANNSYSFLTSALCFGGSDADYVGGWGEMCSDNMNSYYFIGATRSDDFPLVNACNTTLRYENLIVVKINSDKTCNFSTFFGSALPCGIVADENGCCYITGFTESSHFPTVNAWNSTLSGGDDIFISKFNSDGSINFSTYFGGVHNDVRYNEIGNDIAVDSVGNCYITGYTHSPDFPILNGMDSSLGGEKDAFVIKFSPNGTLLYSSFLGGNDADQGIGITVDDRGYCYVVGSTSSHDFPLLNPLDGTLSGIEDAFLTILNPDGTLNYSTYFGGDAEDYMRNIKIHENYSIYIEGASTSSNFPYTHDYRRIEELHFGKPWYSYVLKFDSTMNLQYSTLIDRWAQHLFITDDHNVYVSGISNSNASYVLNAFDETLGGDRDIFVWKLDPDGSLNFSTYLGGNNWEHPGGIAVSSSEEITVGGDLRSSDFPFTREERLTDLLLVSFFDPGKDTDKDGLPDYWEYNNNLDLSDPTDAHHDPDYDGLSNLQEYQNGTNPHDQDTDDDGFMDGKDPNPLSFMNPTGYIIIFCGIIGILTPLYVTLPILYKRRKKVTRTLENVDRKLHASKYTDALNELEEISAYIKKIAGKKHKENWKRLHKQAQINLIHSEKLDDLKNELNPNNSEEICTKLIELLRTVNHDYRTDFIDPNLISEISSLLEEISEKY